MICYIGTLKFYKDYSEKRMLIADGCVLCFISNLLKIYCFDSTKVGYSRNFHLTASNIDKQFILYDDR